MKAVNRAQAVIEFALDGTIRRHITSPAQKMEAVYAFVDSPVGVYLVQSVEFSGDSDGRTGATHEDTARFLAARDAAGKVFSRSTRDYAVRVVAASASGSPIDYAFATAERAERGPCTQRSW